jgi:hypothetical protein
MIQKIKAEMFRAEGMGIIKKDIGSGNNVDLLSWTSWCA